MSKLRKLLWGNFEENNEFDFEHVELVRVVGSLNADIEEAVRNATMKLKEEVRTRSIELGIIYA